VKAEIPPEVRSLARLRYALRKFFNESDAAAREVGLTPQQHQLLLGVAGFTGRGWATIGELAEFLQLRHHTAVGLVDRVESAGLVERRPNPENRRQIEVHLTEDGLEAVRALNVHHRRDVYSLRRMLTVHVVERGGAWVLEEKVRKPAAKKRRRMPD
jgi:DNA-binding MarR family transcriptional regulator